MVTRKSGFSKRDLNIITIRQRKIFNHWEILIRIKRISIKIKRNKIYLQKLSREGSRLPEAVKSSRKRSLQELWNENVKIK